MPEPHSHDRAYRLGMICVSLGAMLFASKGLFAKALYQRGVGFEALVTLRALIAMPLFIWVAFKAGPRQPAVSADDEAKPLAVTPAPAARPRFAAMAAAAIAGTICYYGGAMLDFWALMLIDASIERVLLFSYPAMVVLIGSVMRRKPPDRRVVLAMLATYTGIWLVMGGVDLHEIRANLFGAALVLLAALTTAIYFLIAERYTREIGSTRFAAIGMSASAVVLAIHFGLFNSLDEIARLDAHDWVLMVILGLFCMFIPGLLQAEGVRRVGAQRAAIGSTIGPPTTIVLAAIFFAERLNIWQYLGSAIIVAAVMVLSLGKDSGGR